MPSDVMWNYSTTECEKTKKRKAKNTEENERKRKKTKMKKKMTNMKSNLIENCQSSDTRTSCAKNRVSIPIVSHLQWLVLTVLGSDEVNGKTVRLHLEEAGARKSG